MAPRRSPVGPIRRAAVGSLRGALHRRRRELVATMAALGRPRRFDVHRNTVTVEYIRLSTLELCAQEIATRGVAGAMAEVGVYRGDFAACMNAALPDRTLYLFDTFTGFDADQEAHDRATLGLTHQRDFSETSVEAVLDRMPHRDRCVAIAGTFPGSVGSLDEGFCLVSLDADLYEPIHGGLRYFYPRLAKGGYIFVNDYNNARFPGARQAVLDYCEEAGVSFVPLTDVYGTAIFTK